MYEKIEMFTLFNCENWLTVQQDHSKLNIQSKKKIVERCFFFFSNSSKSNCGWIQLRYGWMSVINWVSRSPMDVIRQNVRAHSPAHPLTQSLISNVRLRHAYCSAQATPADGINSSVSLAPMLARYQYLICVCARTSMCMYELYYFCTVKNEKKTTTTTASTTFYVRAIVKIRRMPFLSLFLFRCFHGHRTFLLCAFAFLCLCARNWLDWTLMVNNWTYSDHARETISFETNELDSDVNTVVCMCLCMRVPVHVWW